MPIRVLHYLVHSHQYAREPPEQLTIQDLVTHGPKFPPGTTSFRRTPAVGLVFGGRGRPPSRVSCAHGQGYSFLIPNHL